MDFNADKFENDFNRKINDSKYSKKFQRRCWYYENNPRDKDAKLDPHPEVRVTYYRNWPNDMGWRNDIEVFKLFKK